MNVRRPARKPRQFAASRLASLVAVALAAVVLLGAAAPSAVAVPRNDDFADAIPLRLGETIKGTTAGATREAGEPQHPGYWTGNAESVWYRFRSPRRVAVLLNIGYSDWDPGIAVYTGRSVRSLRLIDFNANPAGFSRVAFTARAGQTYRIAVADMVSEGYGASFSLGAKAIQTPPNDDLAYAKWLALGSASTGTTRNATRELGEQGLPWERSVWYKLRVPRPARIILRACAVRPDEIELGVYTGRRTNRLTEVSFDGACRVAFRAAAGVVYRIQVTDDWVGRFRLTARRPG
jgi:hypothetical protein